MGKRSKRVDSIEALNEESTRNRDFVMARLGAARSCLQNSLNAVDEALALFVDTEDDDDGEEREDLLDTAVESAGMASRALESAQEQIEHIAPTQGEPWDEEE